MLAFVILAVVLALFSVAYTVVVARELLRNVRKLNTAVRATSDRLVPLTDELQSELAVTSVEIQDLTDHVARVQRERQARPKRRRPGRSRRRR